MDTTQELPLSSGPTIRRGKSKQDVGTPWELIHACERKFGDILYDLAASQENAKAPHYWTETDDSLKRDWHLLSGVLWLNPEFDNIAPWVKKCAEESLLGAKILLLTPSSVGSNWFRDHVHKKAMVWSLNGRITFIGSTQPYPKDCMISAYGFDETGFDVWQWAKEI